MTAHGYGPYSRGVCRCEKCTKAAREYRRAQRARRLATPGTLSHGTRASYDCGCRCERCTAARRDAYARLEKPQGGAA